MQEYTRMLYLDALGIDTYVPRVLLPHCKPSQLLVVDDDVSNGDQDEHVTDQQQAYDELSFDEHSSSGDSYEKPNTLDLQNEKNFHQAGSIVSDILEKKSTEQTRSSVGISPTANEEQDLTKASQAQEEIQRAAEPTVEAASFSLSLWRVGESIQVVDSSNLGEALPTHQLIQNIATGMRYSSQALKGAEVLRWPLVGSQDASWSGAQQMVQGFLDAKLLTQPSQYLFLMGQAAGRAVLGNELVFKDNVFQEPISVEIYGVQALVLPSLADILRRPSLKKPLWQHLVRYVQI